MDKDQSDFVLRYKLETEFFQDHLTHTRYVEKGGNKNEKVKESWSNCEELGWGGFGVVHKQIERATGRYRAVKMINKRRASTLDCSRELLVMAKLSKVCVLAPKETCSSLQLCGFILSWFNGQLF